MLTDKQKAARLRMAIDALQDADAWVQQALGDTDVCYETHTNIQNIVDDLTADVQDLEARAEGEVL
jgi:hypothetical protein